MKYVVIVPKLGKMMEFTKETVAKSVLAKMKASGFPAYMETVKC